MTTQEADLRDQIRAGRFEPGIEFPDRPQKPTLKPNADSKEAAKWAEQLKRWEDDMTIWQIQSKEYRASRNRLDDSFKRAALEYVGLKGHPKADRAFSMAQDQSRSDGKVAVLDTLEEYADLLL